MVVLGASVIAAAVLVGVVQNLPRSSGTASSADLPPPPAAIRICGEWLCAGSTRWFLYGASVYDPGLHPARSGVAAPRGTVLLAAAAHLNTIRAVNFYADTGDPGTVPFAESSWRRVDALIAAASAAGMHVDLELGDYRNILWNDCVDPYAADWARLLRFVALRRNTVTGMVYGRDPAIAMVSLAGEPLPPGTHRFTAATTRAPCSLTYTAAELTAFYARSLSEWKALGATVLVSTGGLGYLNEPASGIDWQAIFGLSQDDVCAIKTYGGMLAFAPRVAAYCHQIGKPVVDEEFGWPQGIGDAERAADFAATLAEIRAQGFAGAAFWNLGYQLAGTSYDVGTSTPLTFAAVQQAAP